MRPAALAIGVVVGLGWAIAIFHGRLRPGLFAHSRTAPHARMISAPIDPAVITTSEQGLGVVGYRVPLPAGLIDGDTVELRFRDALDGAKVEAAADGPRLHATLLHKRIGGDTVAVPLAPGRIDAVELRIRHGFRAPPVLRAAVVFVPVTVGAAGPPRTASPRSMR
jgi:hypothetical protein